MFIGIRLNTYTHCEVLLTLAGPSLQLKCILGPLELWLTFMSVRPSLHFPATIIAASGGRISAIFDTSDFYENLSRDPNVGQTWTKCKSLNLKTYVRCTLPASIVIDHSIFPRC